LTFIVCDLRRDLDDAALDDSGLAFGFSGLDDVDAEGPFRVSGNDSGFIGVSRRFSKPAAGVSEAGLALSEKHYAPAVAR